MDDALHDTWGNRFRIVCDPDAKIIAAGPDRKVGTKDDIVERIVTN